LRIALIPLQKPTATGASISSKLSQSQFCTPKHTVPSVAIFHSTAAVVATAASSINEGGNGPSMAKQFVADPREATGLETDNVVEHPIALEGVAEFGLHDRRSASVELPGSRFLRTAARQKTSSPIHVVSSRAFRER
jgi:hypothetical protein